MAVTFGMEESMLNFTPIGVENFTEILQNTGI